MRRSEGAQPPRFDQNGKRINYDGGKGDAFRNAGPAYYDDANWQWRTKNKSKQKSKLSEAPPKDRVCPSCGIIISPDDPECPICA